jgi:hypothetical protein
MLGYGFIIDSKTVFKHPLATAKIQLRRQAGNNKHPIDNPGPVLASENKRILRLSNGQVDEKT